jgi:hypothetical protein
VGGFEGRVEDVFRHAVTLHFSLGLVNWAKVVEDKSDAVS